MGSQRPGCSPFSQASPHVKCPAWGPASGPSLCSDILADGGACGAVQAAGHSQLQLEPSVLTPASPARGVSPASFLLGSPHPGVHLRQIAGPSASTLPWAGGQEGWGEQDWLGTAVYICFSLSLLCLGLCVAMPGSAHGASPRGLRWAAGLGSLAGGKESCHVSKAAEGVFHVAWVSFL